MKGSRGVVLVHVMVLMVLMAWIASIVLQASLSRQILTKKNTESTENRAALSAAHARIMGCLSSASVPQLSAASNCGTAMPNIIGCLGTQQIGTRRYGFSWCPAPVASKFGGTYNALPVTAYTCKFAVKICVPGAANCSPPSNPCG